MTDTPSTLFDLRHAATDRATIVVVGERRLFAIDGVGGPGAATYRVAADTLKEAGRNLRHLLVARHADATVQPVLETAWWTHPELPPDQVPAAFEDRSAGWHWQQLLEVSSLAEDAEATEAIAVTQRSFGRDAPLLRIVVLPGGRSAQMLHLGGTSSEARTLRALYDAIAADGQRPRGHIHELRLADEHDVPEGRARAILRVPIIPD